MIYDAHSMPQLLPLPTADNIVLQHAELLQVLSDVRKRNKGGRYNKHDQARILFIKSVALRGLRFGKLVPPSDINMIRLAPKHELSGTNLTAMDAWSKRHAPDPRSTTQGTVADITEEQQTTLLRWVARHAADFMAPLDARRGRPAAYRLHFGAYKGCTLSALVRASIAGGRKSLLPDAPNSTPQPGDYLLWLASRAFAWNYPYHLYLYLALSQLDMDGCTVWSETANGMAPLVISDAARERYDEHVRSVKTPYDGEVDPYTAGTAVGADAGEGGGADDDDEEEGEGGGGEGGGGEGGGEKGGEGGVGDGMWTPLGTADTICNGVPAQQEEFFARVVDEMASGERPAYEDMERLDVQPPTPLCMPCFDPDAYHLMPIHFWSPGIKFDVEMPCKNHGWEHAEYMHAYPAWRQRRVCGVFSDYTIAGQRLECSECKRENHRLKALIGAAKTHNARSPRIAELEAHRKATSFRMSTLDPTINKLILERHPGLAMLMPAVLSHRKAVSPEMMMLVSRAARTPQGSHDLEAALREFRAIANAKVCSARLALPPPSLRLAPVPRADSPPFPCS